MIISRGIGALRLISNGLSKKIIATPIRHSGGPWLYRQGIPPQTKKVTIVANTAGALMWWWILWHLWHEYQHITGEFEFPDPSKWTDEELGIPPDDTDELGLRE